MQDIGDLENSEYSHSNIDDSKHDSENICCHIVMFTVIIFACDPGPPVSIRQKLPSAVLLLLVPGLIYQHEYH